MILSLINIRGVTVKRRHAAGVLTTASPEANTETEYNDSFAIVATSINCWVLMQFELLATLSLPIPGFNCRANALLGPRREML
jgi:hypothetical protein